MTIPKEICGICYHPKSEARTCNHPNCPNKNKLGQDFREFPRESQQEYFGLNRRKE